MLKSKPNFSNWKSLKARSHNFELAYSVDCNWYLILLLHKYAFQTTCNHWNRRLQIKEGLFRSQSKLDNDQTSIPKNLVLTIKLQWNFRHLVVFFVVHLIVTVISKLLLKMVDSGWSNAWTVALLNFYSFPDGCSRSCPVLFARHIKSAEHNSAVYTSVDDSPKCLLSLFLFVVSQKRGF